MTEASIMTTLVVRYGTHFKIRLGEWFAGIIFVSMGLLFFGAPDMFARSPEYFAGLRAFGPQQVWGILLLAAGIIRIIALWVNGRKTITPYIRMTISFLSCFVWWQLAVSLFASGVPGLGWAFVPWLLALDMYNVFLSSADAREVFDTKRAGRDGSETTS